MNILYFDLDFTKVEALIYEKRKMGLIKVELPSKSLL